MIALDTKPSSPPRPNAVATQCQSWPIEGSSGKAIATRCYYNGRLIQCCGHGLLSTAYYWQNRLGKDKLVLEMNGSTVQSWSEDQTTWLSFNTLASYPCEVPPWIEQVFPGHTSPTAAATAGDDNGYLVLQWPDNFSLSQLSLPEARLVELSQRALICTAAHPSVTEGAIELRYFAPQHGVTEDIATGSAVRVLSHYWSKRFEKLIATQCSSVGGQLFATFKESRVELGGRCLIADKSVQAESVMEARL